MLPFKRVGEKRAAEDLGLVRFASFALRLPPLPIYLSDLSPPLCFFIQSSLFMEKFRYPKLED